MAMTAWSAKVSSSMTCLSVNSVGSARRSWITPITTPSRMSGTLSVARWPICLARLAPSGNSSVSA